MKDYIIIALGYFLFISLITAVVTLKDKSNAKKGKRRTPERTLFLLALLGGSIAEYFTMKAIRHKTQHKSFMLGLPTIIILQLILVALFLFFK